MSLETLYLSKIRTDGGTQPRGAVDESLVVDYAEAMRRLDPFPPLKVVYDGENYWLYDGFHRRAAAVEAELEKFSCDVLQGTVQDAQWLSFGANQAHGLRRTNADKRRAVEAALRHERGMTMSDRSIAEHCGVSAPLIGDVRRELTVNGFQSNQVQIESEASLDAGAAELRTGRDGRTLNVANIGSRKEAAAKAWPEHDGEFYRDDLTTREVCWSGPRGCWMAIDVLQVGPKEWVARWQAHSHAWTRLEPLYNDPVHTTKEEAVADAALRGGIAMDDLADIGHLPRHPGNMTQMRWLRQHFAEEAGQSIDLECWDEPAGEPLDGRPKGKRQAEDPREKLALQVVQFVETLADDADWKGIGSHVPLEQSGPTLVGQIGFARRNLAAFLKGVEAR